MDESEQIDTSEPMDTHERSTINDATKAVLRVMGPDDEVVFYWKDETGYVRVTNGAKARELYYYADPDGEEEFFVGVPLEGQSTDGLNDIDENPLMEKLISQAAEPEFFRFLKPENELRFIWKEGMSHVRLFSEGIQTRELRLVSDDKGQERLYVTPPEVGDVVRHYSMNIRMTVLELLAEGTPKRVVCRWIGEEDARVRPPSVPKAKPEDRIQVQAFYHDELMIVEHANPVARGANIETGEKNFWEFGRGV